MCRLRLRMVLQQCNHDVGTPFLVGTVRSLAPPPRLQTIARCQPVPFDQAASDLGEVPDLREVGCVPCGSELPLRWHPTMTMCMARGMTGCWGQ
eukprot:18315-Alexandrium_andersonii.AAC.1